MPGCSVEIDTEDETALTVEMEVMDGEQVIFSESREISGKKGETEYVTEVILENIKPWSAEYLSYIGDPYPEETGRSSGILWRVDRIQKYLCKRRIIPGKWKGYQIKRSKRHDGMKIQDDALQKRICWRICI